MQGKPYPNQVLLKLHAMALTQKIEMKHPTTAFVAAPKRDPNAFPEHRKYLLKAFASNPDFDLARSNIDVVVKAMNPSGSSNSSSENVTRASGASSTDAPTTKKRLGKNAQKRRLVEMPKTNTDRETRCRLINHRPGLVT
jgi:hypothetical protein